MNSIRNFLPFSFTKFPKFLIYLFIIYLIFPSVIINVVEGTEVYINYTYSGDTGPRFWHLLEGSSEICECGKNQSPIDLTSEDIKNLAPPPYPNFTDITDVEALNNGHTVECCSDDMSKINIKIEGKLYTLAQFHFHTPSEHRINGKYFDVEQHLVFENEDGINAVVSVLYDLSTKNSTFLDPIISNLPKICNETKKLDKVELLSLVHDLNSLSQTYSYSGSLTTPPCTEGVTWFVNVKPLNIGMQQLLELRQVTGFNSRYTQTRH
ncbi:hypothetical protein Glove_63g112 [Diversispora epigaea]|uniref:carbonic anhydrase n=1 Tax=Diversispora epigaea TaxID=1348612 RepID=A0A397JL00_9GLOM|nr:hypothetical protein Glove_63g112 [Diversispora epigaea]